MAVNAFAAPTHGRSVAGRHGQNRSLEEAPPLDSCTGDAVI
jgi:hypothetical protein